MLNLICLWDILEETLNKQLDLEPRAWKSNLDWGYKLKGQLIMKDDI